MKTTFRDNQLTVRLSKPESIVIAKAHALAESLAAMQPIAPALSEAAKAASGALKEMLEMAGENS